VLCLEKKGFAREIDIIVKQRLHGYTSVSEFVKDAVDSSFKIDRLK
jgi:hypothetical protein